MASATWQFYKLTRAIVFAMAFSAVFIPIHITALAQTTASVSAPNQPPAYARRIIMVVRGERNIVFDEPVVSLMVINPEFVQAELSDAIITLTGLAQGETIVIVSGKSHRQTFAVEVKGPLIPTPEQIAARAQREQRQRNEPSGIYTLSFSPAFGGTPSMLRQSFEYRRRLSNNRTLRIEGNTFKFFGGGDHALTFNTEPGFGLDRLSLGVDGPIGKLDLLDSELNVSPLSLTGYTMRGLHLVSTPDSRLRGAEFFAGLARPSFSLFKSNTGLIGGMIVPVARGDSWRLRAGVLAIASRGYSPSPGQGGFVWHADARYAPDDNTSAEADLDYANGSLSWRARLDARRGAFTIYGEALRLDRRSPLIGIGAQSGHTMDSMRVAWQPNGRVNASVSYNQTASTLFRSQGAKLSSSTLFANLDFSLSNKSRLGFRFTQQQIETAVSASSPFLKLETRSIGVTHNISFARNWTNDFEGNLTPSREQKAGTGLESGVVLRDELHRSWERWSATGYINYARNLPSLSSLILRNPQLLPPALRHAFETDPERFINVNRDALPTLLAGIDLPATGSLDVGLRFQGVFSRYTLSGDVRYSSGELAARARRDIFANFGMSIRLDSANSVQVSGARSFASSANHTSALIFSYTHRFGAGSGAGFQFSRLLGLDHGRVQGRVFFDLNSNGRDDPGEPGIANLKVLLDANHSVTTDQDGRFDFSSVRSGEYNVVLSSGDLGVCLRASTPTEQSIFVAAKDAIKVSFGLNNFGFVSGRVFNDLSLTGEQGAANAPGVSGARISLRAVGEAATDPTLTTTVDASGMYEFRDLAPGSYKVEIDPMTLPPDFQLPAQTSWTLKVQPLNGSYLDIPLSAQRAVSGIVFIDRDNDGQFDPNKDEVVEGARVSAGAATTQSGHNGSYVLRNLPAGKLEVHASLPSGDQTITVTIKLNPEPDIRKGVNLATVSERITSIRR
jgi:hypothetical protein